MASKAYLQKRELEQKDRALEEEERKSKRQLVGNIVGATIGAAGRVAGGIVKNDATWYKNAGFVSDYVQLPTYENLVVPAVESGTAETGYDVSYQHVVTSRGTVLALNYVPRLGCDHPYGAGNSKYDHPINEAMTTVLAQIAKVNSRSVSADPDVAGFYLLTSMEIMRILLWMKTNMEIVGYFNPEQSMIRDALLSARNAMYSFWVDDLAQVKKLYQTMVRRFNREIVLPLDLTIVKRFAWTSMVIIKDAELNKGQYITFSPFAFGTLDPDHEWFKYINAAPTSLSALTSMLNTLFADIALDQDFQTLIGNLRAAIPENKFVTIPEEPLTYMNTVPASDEILMQFHNLRTLPRGFMEVIRNITSGNPLRELLVIKSDGEGLYQDRSFTLNSTFLSSLNINLRDPLINGACCASILTHNRRLVLDYYKDKLNDDDILVSTRLTTAYKVTTKASGAEWIYPSSSVDSVNLEIESEGVELIFDALAFHFDVNNKEYSAGAITVSTEYPKHETIVTFDFEPCIMPNVSTNTFSMVNLSHIHATASNFDWMFPIYLLYCDDDNNNPTRTYPMCEFGNMFTVGFDDINKLHRICDKSLYSVSDSLFVKIR